METDQVGLGQARSGWDRPSRVRSGQVRWGQTRSGWVRQSRVRSGQVRRDQTSSGKIGQVSLDQIRSGMVRSGQVRLVVRSDRVSLELGRLDQIRSSNWVGHNGQARLDQVGRIRSR